MPAPSTTLVPSNTLYPSDIASNPYSKTGTVLAGSSATARDVFTATETGSGRTQALLSGVATKTNLTGTTYTKAGSVLAKALVGATDVEIPGTLPPPPAIATTNPVPIIEIDFLGNPTATYSDIQTTQDSGLAFWRMNSAATFFDTRLLHNGTIIGTPATTAGPYAYDPDLALQFNGTSNGAYVPSATDLVNKANMTVEGWLRVDSLPAGARDVVAKRGAWILQLTSAGRLVWTLKDDNSTATVTTNTTLLTNAWYHVAAVYDSVNISVYVNGVLDNQAAYASGWEAAAVPIRFAQTPSGAAPTYQSSQTASDTNSVVTISKPASTASGDLLIAHIHAGSYGGLANHTVVTTAPSGWAQLGVVYYSGPPDPNLVISAWLYYKVAGSSEPASYQWTLSTSPTWCGAISRFTGVDTLTPIANPVWSLGSSTTSTSTGTHTPNVDNNMVLAFFSMEDPVGTGWSADSGTERYDFGTGSNAMAMYSQTQSSAAPLQVTGTGSGGQDSGAAFWVALAGASPTYAAVSMKDWSFSNAARSASEIARDYSARASGTGTWSNVSSKLRSFSAKGASRQYELNQMEAGTVTLLLKDTAREFDPANTASPYYPGVIPERKVRGRTIYNAVTYNLFYAYVERWPTQDVAPGYQEITLNATDGFDALALAEVSGTLDAGFSGTQINTLLDKALWPKNARAIDAGQYVMAGQVLNGKALTSIQEIADSERGIFFIDIDGTATFHDSAHRGSVARSTTSQATFVDSTAQAGVVYQGYTPSYDRDSITNDWTVSPDSSIFASAPQTQEDSDSIARYWRRSNSRSTRLATNEAALAQAGNLLNETSQPGLRYDTIKITPTTTAGYQTCLALRVSDRVTVVRGTTQKWTGAVTTRDCFIEARQIDASMSNPWLFTFSLSPVSLGNYYATIRRDGPVSYWRMDTQS